jgi:hypothetical protein
MISTVTTTTVTVIASLGLSVALGAVGAIALILLLVEHELVSAAGPRWHSLSRYLRIAIAPLLLAFCAIWLSRVVSLL